MDPSRESVEEGTTGATGAELAIPEVAGSSAPAGSITAETPPKVDSSPKFNGKLSPAGTGVPELFSRGSFVETKVAEG